MSMPGIDAQPLTSGNEADDDPIDRIDPSLTGDPMRTRPASIATVVVAIGLALTSIGLARVLPYTFGGVGDPSSMSADIWAHGTSVSPALVALVFLGILAAIAMRPTRGGRRAASWLAVLAAALVVTGLLEPAQQQVVLFGTLDVPMTPLVYAFHGGLIALVLSAIGEARSVASPGAGPGRAPAPLGTRTVAGASAPA
jgi:hypothetical protein